VASAAGCVYGATAAPATLAGNEAVQTLYITALRNTHALEKQAAQMLQRSG
jgi:hypothetical protein